MTTVTKLQSPNQAELDARIAKEREAKIAELTSGIDISSFVLNENHGSKRFGAVFMPDGKVPMVRYATGQQGPAVLMVDGTWQLADGLNALMAKTGATKLMAWRFDEKEKRYVIDRTWRKSDKTEIEGTLDQFVRRHGQVKAERISSIPGAAAADFLAVAAKEVSKAIKDDKENHRTPADALDRILSNAVNFFKEVGYNPQLVSRTLRKHYPEMWEHADKAAAESAKK